MISYGLYMFSLDSEPLKESTRGLPAHEMGCTWQDQRDLSPGFRHLPQGLNLEPAAEEQVLSQKIFPLSRPRQEAGPYERLGVKILTRRSSRYTYRYTIDIPYTLAFCERELAFVPPSLSLEL